MEPILRIAPQFQSMTEKGHRSCAHSTPLPVALPLPKVHHTHGHTHALTLTLTHFTLTCTLTPTLTHINIFTHTLTHSYTHCFHTHNNHPCLQRRPGVVKGVEELPQVHTVVGELEVAEIPFQVGLVPKLRCFSPHTVYLMDKE